ncbi:hypothetical protein H0484_01270 [Pusillimonas sp. CC-YST705]|uniref:Uncharacterized protein n=1 Tax=Mesopusillimonas faecipullorum TaxID=2755040 RepID=A0ABS8C8N6_9BURK|nr:hypothetical protein [Mesopusillimonas faecipullorum]MCB5362386.1 hypothetical protein [Mesopusillimonas faecipullorum]
MSRSRFTHALLIFSLSAIALQSGATGLDKQPSLKDSTKPTAISAVGFPAGTFTGDDIRLKLDSQGKYTLSGGAVEATVRGTWSVETNGKHTLLRLTPNKNEDDWVFGVRSKSTLQLVDEKKLGVLDRPLDVYEDAGTLTREK